jgi:signal transduction histidine kinase
MQTDDAELEFADLLAASAHDIKNSLSMALTWIDAIGKRTSADDATHRELAELAYEVRRSNDNLVKLLALYRIGRFQYPLNISDYEVAGVLEELSIEFKPLLQAKGIELSVDCPADLWGCFDRDLVLGILNNGVNNAFRYAKRHLRISAREDDGYLVLCAEDDGAGYPEHMHLGRAPAPQDFRGGRSGLGLYFAAKVASMHRQAEREGFISVTNGGRFGGGCFCLYLP